MLSKPRVGIKGVLIVAVCAFFFVEAVDGIVQNFVSMRFTMNMMRDGVQTMGSVTSKRESDRSIYYAYSAGGQEFGGYYRINSDDSDWYFTNLGDSVNVVYSARRPYVSTAGLKSEFSIRADKYFLTFWCFILLTSLGLARIGVRWMKGSKATAESNAD
jgi:hypothetical protein